MLRRTITSIITLTLVCLAGSAHAGGMVVHEDWGGIWDLDIERGICDFPIQQPSETDTLCGGAAFEPDDSEIELQCSGSWTSTTVDITCEGTDEIYPGCIQTITMDYDGTRDGNSYDATFRITATHDGSGEGCDEEPDLCFEEIVTGTRTGPEPAECDATPTESVSWGAVKVRYR